MWKRLLSIVVFFVIASGMVLIWVLNSPSATGRISAAFLKNHFRNGTLDELTIGRQHFVFPGRLLLSDVHVKLTSANEHYKIEGKEITLDGLGRALFSPAEVRVYAQGLSLDHKNIKIPSADFTGSIFVHSKRTDPWGGMLKVPMLEAYRYKAENVSAHVVGGSHGVSFKNLNADFYKGKILGQIDVDWSKGIHYRTDFHFEGIDISALKEVDASVYGQIEGVIQGSVVIGGTAHTFDALGLKIQITKGGRINASLLKFVLPYMPRTEESAALLDLMKQGLKVPVEVAHVDIQSIDEHKISGNVKLGIGRLNLDLNLPVDILYDGNLFSLLEWYRKLGK